MICVSCFDDPAPAEPEVVHIAWLNDMILGVYRTPGAAQRRCDHYRQVQDPSGDWYAVAGGPRWAQRNGSVARLEVETVTVLE